MNRLFRIASLVWIGGVNIAASSMAQDTANRPERPPTPSFDLPGRPVALEEALRERVDQYQSQQRGLREDLRNALAELEDPTRNAVKQVQRKFRAENAEQIHAQERLGAQIRRAMHALRSHRAERTRPAPLPPEVESARADFVSARSDILAARDQLHAQLADASEEQREQLLEQFRNEQRDRLHELKDLKRGLREQIRGSTDKAGDSGGG